MIFHKIIKLNFAVKQLTYLKLENGTITLKLVALSIAICNCLTELITNFVNFQFYWIVTGYIR